MNHDELRHLLGGLVLGGLSRADHDAIERHLLDCLDCREELARFAPLPALLGREDPLPPVLDSPDLLAGLLAEVRRTDRARRRSRTALVAAAAVVVAGAFVGGHALAPAAPAPRTEPGTVITLQPASSVGHTTGDATLVEKPWGTDLTLTITDLPPGGPFRLEVVSTGGRVERAATWGGTPTGRAVVEGASALERADVEAIRVVGPTGPLLVGRGTG